MSTAPRYFTRTSWTIAHAWEIMETQSSNKEARVVALSYDRANAEMIAAALNAQMGAVGKAVGEAVTAACLERAADTIGKAIAAALMTRPTMPSMDAGGEHGEVATEGPNAGFCSNPHCGWCNMQPTPEPAVGEAVRPAVEPQQ